MSFHPLILTTHNTFYLNNGTILILEQDLASTLTNGTQSLENRGNYAIFTIRQIELGDTLPFIKGRDTAINLNEIVHSTSTAWKDWIRTK